MKAMAPLVPYWVDSADLALSASGTPPRVAIIPCPPGGPRLAEAIRSLRDSGLDTLVSLLSPEETRILRLEHEAQLCRETGIDFQWLPVPDHSIPDSLDEFRLLVDRLHRDLRAGRAVGAHCYAGIGRSCMLLACLLSAEGLAPAEAFDRLSEARRLRVPDTWLQIQWVEHFAGSLADSQSPPETRR
jgi:protein-tyrosine phosphatase